jgi:uncharacterized protein with HEPN domain
VKKTESQVLAEASEHFAAATRDAARGLDDEMDQDAVAMRLSAGIEALAGLEPSVREFLFCDEWPLVWGMRNRIAHGYMLVDRDVLRATVAVDLPGLVDRLNARQRKAALPSS